MAKIAYITVRTPFDKGETFILTEMLALKELGADLLVLPRDRSERLFHRSAEKLVGSTINLPWFSPGICAEFLKQVITNPLLVVRLITEVALRARNPKIALKNLIILPKGLYLARLCRQESVTHIHAHWASTTSTMAYIISMASSIPWSFTAHRWDIREDNIIKTKVAAANFVRVISVAEKKELARRISDESLSRKIEVIHMGVTVSGVKAVSGRDEDVFTVVCPANLVPVKGHSYLLEACRKLISERKLPLRCIIAGDGPLAPRLKSFVSHINCDKHILFPGKLPHEELAAMYEKGLIDAVVLPSIVTDTGEYEGIPVALMEAMSYGIPVVSTYTGSIPELVSSGTGVLVEEKNADAIAGALEHIMRDCSFRASMHSLAKEKIEKEFNIALIALRLFQLFTAPAYADSPPVYLRRLES